MNNTTGLLGLLEESGEQQCLDLRSKTAEQVTEVRRKAFAQARERVAVAVREERARMAEALGRIKAEVETTLRRRMLAHDAEVLAEGRRQLLEALRDCWHKAAARRVWSSALLETAASVINAREWRIECPQDWPEDERSESIQRAAKHYQAKVEVQPDESLEAGLRLVSGGLCVDMSLSGLLRDEGRIDGALLGLVAEMEPGETT